MFFNRQLLTLLFCALASASAIAAEESVNNRPAPATSDVSATASQTPAPVVDLAIAPETNDSRSSSAPIVDLAIPSLVADLDKTAKADAARKAAAPVGDLWERIRQGYGMPELESGLIQRHERWYASHPQYVERMVERSRRYLYYITQEVERRGMPSEIALLPIIESAFNPGANSSQQASGIWQFIPSTAKKYGMERNWWYDGRRDIISATSGALDYLQKLHEQFGDWELALAAYNWGEGAVSRAILRNRKLHKPTSFAYLRLPPETRNYVPKLLAVKNIVSDPERFGLSLAKIPNQPYFAQVSTDHPIDVKLVAQLADISMDEFLALNPGHNRPVILEDESSVLLLPVDKLETFKTNLKNYVQPLVSWQPYKTHKGDLFDQLARDFNMAPAELRRVNGLSRFATTCSGQTILVPISDEQTDTAEFHAFNTDLVSIDDSFGKTFIHRVRRGECFSSIARQYHISIPQLRSLNKGAKGALRLGQHLVVMRGNTGPRTRLYSRHYVRHNAKVASRKKDHSRKTDINVAYNR